MADTGLITLSRRIKAAPSRVYRTGVRIALTTLCALACSTGCTDDALYTSKRAGRNQVSPSLATPPAPGGAHIRRSAGRTTIPDGDHD